MYFRGSQRYDTRGGQRIRRAPFLILMVPKGHTVPASECMRAAVRDVALRQVGHWMMGHARFGGKDLLVSGAYGADGLVLYVSPEIYEKWGHDVPAALRHAWNKGGGHNGAGSEREQMAGWARHHEALLRAPRAKKGELQVFIGGGEG